MLEFKKNYKLCIFLFIYLFIYLSLPSNIDARGVRVGSLFSNEASLLSNLLTSKKRLLLFLV